MAEADRSPAPELVTAVTRTALAGDLSDYLAGQRWFGDKDRTVTGTACLDVAVAARPAGGWFVLAPMQVDFAAGEPSRYLMLLQLTAVATDGPPPLALLDDAWALTEPGPDDGFAAWWLAQFSASASLAGEAGTYQWEALPGFTAASAGAPSGVLISAVGQSNTTVRYGHQLFGKIFRRLRTGINPDEEISRFLAANGSFRQLPMPFGSVRLTLSGETYPVGVLFSYVDSIGEGWGWTQSLLTQRPLPSFVEPARRLGERTGQLHLALATDAGEPDFTPEPVAATDIAGWQATVAADLDQVLTSLAAQQATVPTQIAPFVTAMVDTGESLRARIAGHQRLAGTVRTRVHGDYHLGQLLRTPDDDWVLLDFEGEPARTIAERRAKTAPMKDVADMLRSFGYARGMAGRDPAADDAALDAWLADAREAFLAGYRETVSAAPVALVPPDNDSFAAALAAWELAKALYEIRYELGNRPDWLDVPIRTMVNLDSTLD